MEAIYRIYRWKSLGNQGPHEAAHEKDGNHSGFVP